MYRNTTCGALTLSDEGKAVKLCGWVQRSRDLGGMTFVDLRDRYGLTQLVFNMDTDAALCQAARELGREYVIQVSGKVAERSNKNPNLPTGDIEILVSELNILNPSLTPPFTIEDDTDGGEEIRMQYRYLDLRRNMLKNNITLRHRITKAVRDYLDGQGFIEIETPVLIKSTPEGARDFVVPSRVHHGEFYALPQSPQTFKQLLMVSGFDKYFQIVKCFRDEDLRADRQPEFTQIDCEMSFVEEADVLETFEGMTKDVFQKIAGVSLQDFPRMSYEEAMANYGSDKPDIRFGMTFVNITDQVQGKGFNVFDQAAIVAGICAEGCAEYSRKQIDALTDFVKRPQIGAKGLVYIKLNPDGSVKSSIDKFYTADELKAIGDAFQAKPGDLLLILAGDKEQTLNALSELRLEMGNRLGLRKPDEFKGLWVVDFPLFAYSEEEGRWHSRHHPFTSPKKSDEALIDTDPGAVMANAYDLVINGNEIAGGSIRIHDRQVQEKVFSCLGMSEQEAEDQFGFLMGAFEYGAPPHGGLAFGLDRLCAIIGGTESIRDFIAFPKNNAARDTMLDSPSVISPEQLKELGIKTE